MNIRSCADATISKGDLVLVRVDYNVPLSQAENGDWVVSNDARIQASLPTLQWLKQKEARVIVVSHLGRPKSPDDSHLSLSPCVRILEKAGFPTKFVSECTGKEVAQAKKNLQPGEFLLLENLRFDPREKKLDAEFAAELSQDCSHFINDAFSVCHRKTTSTTLVPTLLPSSAGFGLQKEVTALSKLLETIERPFVVIVGGAKLSDKVSAVEHLAKLADVVLLGGAVANTFLKAEGLEIYRSFVEESTTTSSGDIPVRSIVSIAKKLLKQYDGEKILKDNYIPLPKIIVPIDVIAAPDAKTSSASLISEISLLQNMRDSEENEQLAYFDIGPKTRRLYQELIYQAKTVFWNGPMGLWENKLFATGTKLVGQAVAQSNAYSVLGGGDTVAAVEALVGTEGFGYLSSGGGAALEFLSGSPLPGIVPLIEE